MQKFGHIETLEVVTLSPFPGSPGRAATISCTCSAEFFVESKTGPGEVEFAAIAKAHVLTHVATPADDTTTIVVLVDPGLEED